MPDKHSTEEPEHGYSPERRELLARISAICIAIAGGIVATPIIGFIFGPLVVKEPHCMAHRRKGGRFQNRFNYASAFSGSIIACVGWRNFRYRGLATTRERTAICRLCHQLRASWMSGQMGTIGKALPLSLPRRRVLPTVVGLRDRHRAAYSNIKFGSTMARCKFWPAQCRSSKENRRR
jgi:hypothetical protein